MQLREKRAMPDAPPLRIFISHKMPSDTTLASEIGGKLALYGGSTIEVKHAGMFRYGEDWRKKIQHCLNESHWLIYLFTEQDEDWGFCLFECGYFRATMEAEGNRRLITLARSPEQINAALKEFNAAPMTQEAMYKLLDEIYRQDPWNISPNLKDETLRESAASIVSLFTGGERVEANFDVAPSVVIEFHDSGVERNNLKNGRMPGGTIISGVKDWQKLFNRELDTGAWLWTDLTSEWAHKEVYEFLLARIMYDALEKRIPKGIMMRSLSSDEVYRLTLRRYERLANTKVKLYFTASLLDLPFSISIQKAREPQTVLYHLVALSWYFRRRVVDELYRKVLELRSAARQKKVSVGQLFDEIAYELVDIDAQSIIRGVDNRLIVEESLGNSVEVKLILDKFNDWYRLRTQMFEKMSLGPEALEEVANTIGLMSALNFEFYKLSARAYADAAAGLEAPHTTL
jgi:hypothetical protein